VRLDAAKKKWALILLALMVVGLGLALKPSTTDPASTAGSMRVVSALVLVVGLAIVGLHAAKRYIPGVAFDSTETAIPIRILGGRKLADGKSLLIVQVNHKRFLLGIGRDTITNLANVSGDGDVPPLDRPGAI
jgi:flagellar biogenesis protein FliO